MQRGIFYFAEYVINRVFNTHARAYVDGVIKKGYFCEIIGQNW